MVSGINSIQQYNISQLLQNNLAKGSIQNINPEDTFNDLSTALDADKNGISKEQLKEFFTKLQKKGGVDNRALAYIQNMINKFDKISGGKEYITLESFTMGVQKCLINQALLVYDTTKTTDYSNQLTTLLNNAYSDPLLESLNDDSYDLLSSSLGNLTNNSTSELLASLGMSDSDSTSELLASLGLSSSNNSSQNSSLVDLLA